MEDMPSKTGYGKRPLWQWIVIYVVVGGIVYGLVYYFVFAKRGGYNAGTSDQNTQQPAPSRSLYNY